jgi:hypothetical protein
MVYVTKTTPSLGFYVKGTRYKFVAGRFDIDAQIQDPALRAEAAVVLERISKSEFTDGVVKEADFAKAPPPKQRQKTPEQIVTETARIEPIDGKS